MLKVLHRGLHQSLPLNPAALTGNAEIDSQSEYVRGLVGGRLAALAPTGVVLADGLATAKKYPIGFIVNDAAGYYFENAPALASGQLTVSSGNQVVVTDQIDTDETFALGDLLYAGSGAKAGLVTKTPAEGATVVGVAGSTASAANPELKVIVA